jgi:membrane-associated phospholipid phosphatase
MQKLLIQLAEIWKNQVHPPMASFFAFFSVFWLGICIVTTYLLAEISDEVLEQDSFAIDKAILLHIHQLANPTLDILMVSITRLGDPKTVVPLTLVITGLLWWQRQRIEAQIFALNAAGGAVLSYVLKLAFNKSRPQLWESPIIETTFSYPSGHALGSMVLYGFLSYVLATIYPRYAKLLYGVATLLIVLIGLSRLYLGVHWPTDILAGYAIGFLWITVCITLLRLARALQAYRKEAGSKAMRREQSQ